MKSKFSIAKMARAGLLAGSLTGLLMSQSSFAASGDTEVEITFPPLIILYYYSSIQITVTAADFSDALGLGALGCSDASAPGLSCDLGSPTNLTVTGWNGGTSVMEVDADITTDDPGALDSVISFDINNAWAVRALASGNLDATVTGQDGVFSNVDSDLAGNNTVVPSLTLTAGDNIGDLTFDVDMDTLTDPESAVDTITIEVTNT